MPQPHTTSAPAELRAEPSAWMNERREDPAVPAVLARVADLLRDTALTLGMDDADAREVARDGLLAIDERLLSVVPVVADDAPATLLITLMTEIDIFGEAHPPVKVLQHASGMLVAYRASLGLSTEGMWLIHRCVEFDGMDSQALIRALMITRWLEPMLAQSSLH
jgi:hypothetical protein